MASLPLIRGLAESLMIMLIPYHIEQIRDF